MRNFIVSDLHGDGNVYDSIISYLENLAKDSDEEVTLYINGDLIDRGYACAEMLLDVKDRVENPRTFKVEYIAGNHELMMWQDCKGLDDRWPVNSNWFDNGGYMTAYGFEWLYDVDILNDVFNDTLKFVSKLKLYHKFEEKLNDKRIVLVHAKCPSVVLNKCNITVDDDPNLIHDYVWARREYDRSIKVGHNSYFTIIGHTPLATITGYKYYPDQNYLNIDGGCAGYVNGETNYNHVPLVEIDSDNNRLIILTFNNSNEIICGNYFDGESTPINNLDKYRKYINNDVKLKRMTYQDGFITFV